MLRIAKEINNYKICGQISELIGYQKLAIKSYLKIEDHNTCYRIANKTDKFSTKLTFWKVILKAYVIDINIAFSLKITMLNVF